MRDYGVVSPKFWIGETGKALRGDPNAQLVALYLMTCPHANMIGIFHCPVLYIAHEVGIPFEGASKALERLSEGEFCTYDQASETVFVHRMASFQVGPSLKPDDNRVKSVAKEWANVAVPSLQAAFAAIYSVAFHLPEPEKKTRASKAPSKPLRSQEQDKNKNKTPCPPDGGPDAFETFWQAYPRKEAKKDAQDAFAKLNPDAGLLALMLASIGSRIASGDWNKERIRFVPLPATWLRAERWTDEAPAGQTGNFFAGAL